MTRPKTKSADSIRLHAFVNGMVQGVNFRYYTCRQAESLGVTGWVANRGDDTVEVVAEGVRPALQSLLDWLHHGPPSAAVMGVQVNWEKATDEFTSFRVRYL
jgi:acylphosphatase